MKVALVQSPCWTTENPPYALSLLNASLKIAGHETVCFDFNLEVYRFCQQGKESLKTGINEESWSSDYRGNIWYDAVEVQAFISAHSIFFDSLVNAVIASGASVIGFSVISTSRFFSAELARRIKEKDPNKIIVFGGFLCSRNCYDMAILKDLPFIDYTCFREGEVSFVSLICLLEKECQLVAHPGFGVRLKTGEIIDGQDVPFISDLNTAAYADFSGFERYEYTRKQFPIATSRGCINRCVFCDQSTHWGPFRKRSAKNVFDELSFQFKNYPQTEWVRFNDYLINGDMRILYELCDLLVRSPKKFKWCSYAVIRKEMDAKLLRLMKKAGCNSLVYGVESGCDRVLKLMRKGYTAELAERTLRETHMAGIALDFNIITGFPGETAEDFRQTKEFVRRCKKYAQHYDFNVCLLLKGSFMFIHPEFFGMPPVDFNSDWLMKWQTKDGVNTFDMRKKRLEELLDIVR